MSSEGNAIWYSKYDRMIEYSKYLGTTSASLHVPIKDPSKECPHDNLKSNWIYRTGNRIKQDVDNSVRIHCLKGKHNPNISI